MGDASDNIPGIAGVGEKTAKALIAEFSSLENLYENTDKLKGKLQEKVIASKDSAFMSKVLATIDINADIGFNLNDLQFKFPLPESARKMLAELEFATVLKKDIFAESTEDVQIENIQKGRTVPEGRRSSVFWGVWKIGKNANCMR